MTVVVNENVTLISGPLDSSGGGTDYHCCHLDGEPLVDQVEQFNGKNITVRYWVSSTPLTSVEEADEQTLKQVMGFLDADISHSYSDVTGYLWTDEHLKVGGHNVLEEIWELCNNGRWVDGKYVDIYLLMEITVHEEPN
jgi:hypothetical protein